MQQQSAVTQDELLAPAPDAGVFSVLDDVECSSLLHDGVIGRVAFADPDLVILPVTYDWVDGVVVFRTSPSSSLARLPGQVVAFEVDDIEAETGVGWSVLLSGRVGEGTPAQAEQVTPWAAGDRPLVLTITPTALSGRVVSRPEEEA